MGGGFLIELLGDYQIQRRLGEGPLGEVFLAEHRFLKRPFALKLFPAEFCVDDSFVHRLEQQMHTIASLDHPNIVKIHNITAVEGRYFLVSEAVVDALGQTMHLDRYLMRKGAPLQEEEILSLLRQVASALDYAHSQRVEGETLIHGAMKPTNLLIVQAEEGVRVLLSDFALTRLVGEEKAILRTCEQLAKAFVPMSDESMRSFLRSFGFIAPEQKSTAQLSPMVDSFAFGTLAYYLLTRKMPEGAFDLPSRLGIRACWDQLIVQCLQENPTQRPLALSQALEECLQETRGGSVQMSFEFPPATPLKPVLRPKEIARPEYESDPAAQFMRETTVSPYVPQQAELYEIEPLLTEMVIIPGGTYLRGSNEGARDEMPRHSITLSSFAVDIHPVTNEQFVRFLQAMGGEKDSNNNDIIRLRDARIKRSAGKLIIEAGYAKHPVVAVTWYGAVAYAKWIGKRLLTEAEWEVAALGGNQDALYPTGQTMERSQANFFSSDTMPVMSFPPNGYGLYDMAGNVYNWCSDWYAYNTYDSSVLEPENPQGPMQGVYRVLRGGCWKSLKEDLRCSHRHRNNPGAVNGTYGFRCGADVQ
jgi:formylglycine-generating enzyme required for sulfatase activity